MGRYNKKPEEQQEKSTGCSVPGCPLHKYSKVGGEWYCPYHANAPESDWPVITQRAVRYQHVIAHALKVRVAGPVVCECDKDKYYKTGNALTQFAPGETWVTYERRLRHLVAGLMAGNVQEPAA